MTPALTLEEAHARILALAAIPAPQNLPLDAALGRYLIDDLTSRRTQPSADLSAMDGYAIGAKRPADDVWSVIGESRAGTPFPGAIGSGECIRISTGAHMPAGGDRVLIQENAERVDDRVQLTGEYPTARRHVRGRGFDFTTGDTIIAGGTQVTPAHIALAASAGHGQLTIGTAPKIAILDCGDELVAEPEQANERQLPASNGIMLHSMIAPMGCEIVRIGPVKDHAGDLDQALRLAENADILITTGGASVGDHDLIQPALAAWGATLDFWRVAMKPGKPILVATRSNQVIFGLPGNPVSAYVTAFLFVLPLIRACMGAAAPLPKRVSLKLGAAIGAGGPRREFLRGYWDGEAAEPLKVQDSSALAALARANCLIDRTAHCDETTAGDTVPCYLLHNGPFA